MRGNTNPCSVCKYCDDSCDVCLHQPYEHTVAARYCEASSGDEDEGGAWDDYASTDVDSASDEEGSWFTTPWSQLITQRVAGYEVDPTIGVQLEPLEEEEKEGNEDEQRAKEERHRRWAAAQEEVEEDGEKTRGRRRRLRRRRRRREDSPAAAPEPTEVAAGVAEDAAAAAEKDAEVVANGEVPAAATPDDAEPAANDEVRALFSDGAAQPANPQAREDDAAVPKDTHNNMWRATVHSYVSVVSVS